MVAAIVSRGLLVSRRPELTPASIGNLDIPAGRRKCDTFCSHLQGPALLPCIDESTVWNSKARNC